VGLGFSLIHCALWIQIAHAKTDPQNAAATQTKKTGYGTFMAFTLMNKNRQNKKEKN